jgi:hypothetical protein
MITWKNQISERLEILNTKQLFAIDFERSIDAIFESLEKHPQLGKLYSQNVSDDDFFSLKSHTSTVISQYMNYFYKRDIPKVIPKSVFFLMLALHDIGKPIAIEKGNRELQHYFTSKIINQIKDHLPCEVKDILALIDGDPLGKYFTGTSIEAVNLEIIQMSERSSFSFEDFFHLLVIYYQVDAGSYFVSSKQNGAISSIFRSDLSFNERKKRLWFSAKHEKKFNLLETSLFGEKKYYI